MHAHERTLLARMGFADPDRRDPLHEIACRYVATQPVAQRLVGLLKIECSQRPESYCTEEWEVELLVDKVIKKLRAASEFEVAKGERQYRSTVGFVDVLLRMDMEERHTSCRRRVRSKLSANGSWYPDRDSIERYTLDAGIEVKTTDVPISDAMRQINLYRSYSDIKYWILATTYPLSQSQFDCLANARILHVYLGQRFQDFVKEQANSQCSSSVEV